MSQENIFENAKLQKEVKKKLPPLRSNSTRPQQRGLALSISRQEKDQKRDQVGNNHSCTYDSLIQHANESNQDLGVLLEQQKLENKLNDQELQAIANRIQFIQNQQMNVWKKTNDLYEKAVCLYENKKRCQIEKVLKDQMKDKKEKELEYQINKNEQLKGSIKQKININNEQLLSSKKKQAQDIKEKSRELNQLRDYFRTTFQQGNKQKYEVVKQGVEKAQAKIQNYKEEQAKQFKENYWQRIFQEQTIKQKKVDQIKELEEVERSLLDQFKKTKMQQQQLVNQLDEAQTLKPEQIEEKYPVFASLAQKNIYETNQFDISLNGIQDNRNNSISNHNHNSSFSPFKKQILIRNRQNSSNKVQQLPVQQIQQDETFFNKSQFIKQFNQQQYSSIQPKQQKNNTIQQDIYHNSSKNTIQNGRYGNIYRSVTSKKQNFKPSLNYSAIYEDELNSKIQDTPSIKQANPLLLEEEGESQSIHEDKQQSQLLQIDNLSQFQQDQKQINNNNNNNENKSENEIDKFEFNSNNNIIQLSSSPSPEKNNSTKVSPTHQNNNNNKQGGVKHQYNSKLSQGKIDLSMYQPQNNTKNNNNKKMSLENNSSSYLIATEGDVITSLYKRNKFNHFGDIMLNREDVQKQRRLLLSSSKQARSKSFVNQNKIDVASPYQSNNYTKQQ